MEMVRNSAESVNKAVELLQYKVRLRLQKSTFVFLAERKKQELQLNVYL